MKQAGIELRILSLYIVGSEIEAYNISELARRSGGAYPHVHAAVKGLVAQGVLKELRLGRSRYCTVDLSSDLARNLLAQASLLRKRATLSSPNLRNMDAEVQRLALDEPSLLSAIYKEGALRFVVAEKKTAIRLLRQTNLINVSFATPAEFRAELLRSFDLLDGATILYGYERLLLSLSPIHEQLRLNYSRLFRGQGQSHGAGNEADDGKISRTEVRP